MIQKERATGSRESQDILKLINRFTQGKPYILNNWEEKRDFDAKNDGLDELKNAFATLVNDLKTKGIIQK